MPEQPRRLSKIASHPSDDHHGPTAKSTRAPTSLSSSTKAKRKPTVVARTRLNPQQDRFLSPLFIPSNALLRAGTASSSIQLLPLNSISSPLLLDMQDQSPPPYTPLESDINDSSHFTRSRECQPTPSPLQSIAGSSTTFPVTLSHPCSSSASFHTGPCSHSQSHVRRRNRTSSGSHPIERFPSPTNLESETEDDTVYTPQIDRHRSPKGKKVLVLNEVEDSSRNGTSKRPTSIKRKWSWRHWLFALAAGVVGLGDGRDDEREEKVICTTPGGICAGETETETDEPSRHLPTARVISPSESSPFPASTWQHLLQKLIPLLFEFSRLLSIVPAFFGTLWNLYCLIWPPSGLDSVFESGGWGGRRTSPEKADFFVAALWSILTGYQCLALTTGLLTRWQTYYPPLATLIRLLALQGICWPATHVTLTVLDHAKRPVVCWCVVGTTTCFSRSVQIWVTSNISVDLSGEEGGEGGKGTSPGQSGGSTSSHPANARPGLGTPTFLAYTLLNRHRIHRPLTQRKPRFKWASTERRWDWKDVSLKCVLPAGILYFVMAWVGEFRREWA